MDGGGKLVTSLRRAMKRNEPSQWTWEPQAAKGEGDGIEEGEGEGEGGTPLYMMRNESVKHEVSLRDVWARGVSGEWGGRQEAETT